MQYSNDNPFAQADEHWKVTFMLPHRAAGTAEEAFNDIAISVSAFETDEKNHIWTIDLLCGSRPDMADIERRLLILSSLHHIDKPLVVLGRLEPQDWLAQVAQNFPPLAIGCFYVHGSHDPRVPPGTIPIKVDAGAAFGSGEHGTTRGCLEAIHWLARRREVRRVLDMGCGSAILAIAAAKVWNAEVLAADIDPVAVRVAQENVRVNRVQAQVTCAVSDGYAGERVRRGRPYDLILSNILARPLVAFAPDLEAHLAADGAAVLSGLLRSQEKEVLSAHLMQGLKLKKRILHGEWCTLILTR